MVQIVLDLEDVLASEIVRKEVDILDTFAVGYVHSETEEHKVYKQFWHCTCDDFKYNRRKKNGVCKHLKKIMRERNW